MAPAAGERVALAMIRPGRTARSISGIHLFLGLALLQPALGWASGWAGRPLTEALSSLRAPEFSIIFSSELVPDALRVAAEPKPGPPEQVARELLSPFGLSLKNVAPGLYAVVR